MPNIQSHAILGDKNSFNGLGLGAHLEEMTRINVGSFFSDFTSYSDGKLFTLTKIGADDQQEFNIHPNEFPGVLRIDAGSTVAGGSEIRGKGSFTAGGFVVARDSKDIIYMARFRKAVAGSGGPAIFCGMCRGATTIGTDGEMIVTDDFMGFHTSIDSAELTFQAIRQGTPDVAVNISTGITMTDNTWVTVGFRAKVTDISDDASNGTIEIYVNEETSGLDGIVPQQRIDYLEGPLGPMRRLQDDVVNTANAIPDSGSNLNLNACCVNTAAVADLTFDIDFIYVGQER